MAFLYVEFCRGENGENAAIGGIIQNVEMAFICEPYCSDGVLVETGDFYQLILGTLTVIVAHTKNPRMIFTSLSRTINRCGRTLLVDGTHVHSCDRRTLILM